MSHEKHDATNCQLSYLSFFKLSHLPSELKFKIIGYLSDIYTLSVYELLQITQKSKYHYNLVQEILPIYLRLRLPFIIPDHLITKRSQRSALLKLCELDDRIQSLHQTLEDIQKANWRDEVIELIERYKDQLKAYLTVLDIKPNESLFDDFDKIAGVEYVQSINAPPIRSLYIQWHIRHYTDLGHLLNNQGPSFTNEIIKTTHKTANLKALFTNSMRLIILKEPITAFKKSFARVMNSIDDQTNTRLSCRYYFNDFLIHQPFTESFNELQDVTLECVQRHEVTTLSEDFYSQLLTDMILQYLYAQHGQPCITKEEQEFHEKFKRLLSKLMNSELPTVAKIKSKLQEHSAEFLKTAAPLASKERLQACKLYYSKKDYCMDIITTLGEYAKSTPPNIKTGVYESLIEWLAVLSTVPKHFDAFSPTVCYFTALLYSRQLDQGLLGFMPALAQNSVWYALFAVNGLFLLFGTTDLVSDKENSTILNSKWSFFTAKSYQAITTVASSIRLENNEPRYFETEPQTGWLARIKNSIW